MSSSVDYAFILSLISAQEDLFRIGGPILIILGTVSNMLSLTVFAQKTLRKNTCSIYFMAFNIANLFLIYSSFLPATLETGYNITPTSYSIILCRLSLYAAFAMNCLCPFYLILASIDRVLITSPNARVRKRSTRRYAYISIIVGALYWMVKSIHVPIFSAIIQVEVYYFYCTIQPGLYTTAVTYGSLIKETSTPLAMVFFGLWSVKNIRRMRRVAVAPVMPISQGHTVNGSHSIHAKDHQLIFMLFIDIGIYILFSSIVAITLLYSQFTQYEINDIHIQLTYCFLVTLSFCVVPMNE